MSEVLKYRKAADEARKRFESLCLKVYSDGTFGFYKDCEAGKDVDPKLVQAWEDYREKLHAYYLARDGELGFLGKYEKREFDKDA